MALINKPFTFTAGATIVASEHNSNADTIYNDYNGNITNANVAAAAAIVDTKLAQITTASKVSGAALTSLSSTPSGAGALPVANGGTALTSGTSGGILGYTGTGTLASSVLLASNGVVLGAGAGATPTATTAGTADQVLRVPGAGGTPAFGTVDLTKSAAVTGILTSVNGGTGNGFAKLSGPATTEKTFTLPNATSTILTDNAAVTVAQGGTGVASNTAFAVLCGGTTSTNPVQSIASVGTANQVLTSNGAGSLPTMQSIGSGQLPNFSVLQLVNTNTGAASSGTTAIPDDDTIPQSSEGDQYMTLAITPGATTNKLVIEVVCHIANDAQATKVIGLFQDSTANALAVATSASGASLVEGINLVHFMSAGTTSATTFKVRAGAASGTTTFNGVAAARKYGGVLLSSITIWELKS